MLRASTHIPTWLMLRLGAKRRWESEQPAREHKAATHAAPNQKSKRSKKLTCMFYPTAKKLGAGKGQASAKAQLQWVCLGQVRPALLFTPAPSSLYSARLFCVPQTDRPSFCDMQVACGCVIALASWAYFQTNDAWWGTLLGLLTAAVGATGLLGVSKRALNLTTASFAAGLLVLALVFGLVGRVQRQQQVDCALAELLAMDMALDQALEHSQTSKEAAFGTVQMRLVS